MDGRGGVAAWVGKDGETDMKDYEIGRVLGVRNDGLWWSLTWKNIHELLLTWALCFPCVSLRL